MTGQMSGDDASLTRAFVAFCHTQLAHAQPDRYDWKEVQGAIYANAPLLAQFVALFRLNIPQRASCVSSRSGGPKLAT